MKVRIYELINAKDVLERIYQNKNMPTRVSYKVYCTLSKLDSGFKFFESKKSELFKSYGVRDGDRYIIPQEHQKEFYDELNAVGELECEEDIDKVDISLDIDLGISPAEIALLEPFINFVE